MHRLFCHLVVDVKQHTDELLELCRDNKDLKKAKKLEKLYGQYHEDFVQLIRFLSIQQDVSDGSEVECLGEAASKVSEDCIKNVTGHSLDFNVDAPCFVPFNTEYSTGDEVEVDCPAQWDHEALPHSWHGPPVLHAHPWPHHFHLPPHHPTSTYPGYHNTMSIPMVAYPFYPGNFPHVSHHNYSVGEEGDTNYDYRRPNRRYRRKHESKRDVSHTSSKSERRTERNHEALPGLHPFKQTGSVTTIVIDEKTTQGQVNTVVTKTDESFSRDLIQESSSEVVPHIKGTVNPERTIPDIPTLMDDYLHLSERLQDFPALGQAGKKIKVKKLPRAKFSSKLKFSIQDLFKTYGNSDDSNRSNQDKNLSHSYRREKTPRASVFADKTKCPCKNQNNLFTHGRTLFEKVPEEVKDEVEADGWKKVKPRFHKNRDNVKQISVKENLLSAHSCQVCQSTYRRRYESSKQNKRVNIRRNSHLTSNHYGSPRNNCSRDALTTHALDLHYNNMLVSPHITQRSGKLNNEVNAPVSKNDRVLFVESKTVASAPGVIRERGLLDTVTKNHNPLSPYLESNCIDQLITDNQDLDNDACDDLGGTSSLLLSPFLDDDFFLQTNFQNLSTTVSSSSIVDNEEDCNADSQNNMDLSGELSIDDDNTVNDAIPVVEDAQDMHEEFMKYLNCSTWPTQMDEIDKFESMIAGNNPSDPVLMYPSVSVEQFTEFIQRHPDEAQAFRREITFKLKKIRETESKQQQAYEKRLELLKSKTDKVRGFVQKVKDVQLAQDRLALKRKHQIDEKLRKAEENRKNYLSIIRRKAHDEEEKLKEIAFINELEAQNRRHDSLALRQEHEERLQCIIDERQRRVEEKAAKEAAAEERRRIIEAERQEKLLKISEARRLKELTIDRKHQERETQRLETAREKAREREERLQARDAAQRATAEELQKRIQQKQEDSARRHQENIESVRQRALEVGLHRNLEDSVNISPISKTEDPVTSEPVQCQDDPEILKLKSLKKKRLRKIRARLTSKVSEFLDKYPFQESKAYPFGKALDDIKQSSDIPDSVDFGPKLVALKDTLLKHYKTEPTTFVSFMDCKGFLTLCRILKGYLSPTARSVNNTHDICVISTIVEVYNLAFYECDGKSYSYLVKSNEIMALIDILRVAVAGLYSKEKWIKVAGRYLLI
uniref:S phase cyclin A-associated protein in the endoplasmic reticulum n=1 Tax=Lygus hesperus TaxID=30085 RepID=A0A146L5E1_LYGHE